MRVNGIPILAGSAVGACFILLSTNVAAQEVLLSFTPPSEAQQKYVKPGTFGALSSRRATIQTAQGQAPNSEADQTTVYVSIDVVGNYDNWSNTFNQDDSGEQFSESVSVYANADNFLRPKDSLSFSLSGGHVQSDVNRGSLTDSTSGFSDTFMSVGYSMPAFGTWSTEAELQFNLPTGKTKLTELERLAVPTTGVVSNSFLGSGFDAGFDLKFRKPIKDDSYYIGAGYTRRGSYDPTIDVDDDTVDSGHEFRALAGWNNLSVGDVTLNIDGTYTRGQGYADTDSNSVGISVLANANVTDDLEISGSYSFQYNDSQPTKAPSIVRKEQYRQGT